MATLNTEAAQSQELAKQLWAIANDLRGNMDASKFKNYILGTIFYRYLSERTERYMDELLKDEGGITYREALKDEDYAPVVKEWSIEHLGYIIEPKYLYDSLIDEIRNGEFSIEHFERAINELTGSTIGQESEAAFDKLFDDMNLQDKDLGKEVSDRTSLISKVMMRIYDINFHLDDAKFDVLGTAYMILIGLFASDAGKKGGEFFTPTCASTLLARLVTVGLEEVTSVCDPCAGSGSLLLEVKNHLTTHKVGHFYANELNGSTYNLLRMNLLMHGVPYRQFTTFNSDALGKDPFDGCDPFQIQVSNPPYSAKWSAAPSYLDDPRFSAAGALAPKTKADFAFLEGMVHHMASNGRIAILLPHGVLFRGNAELKIRRYLIDELNVLDAVIGLPANLFHGTGIPVAVLVLKRDRNGDKDNILFIDASKYFEPGKNMNILRDEDIDRIVQAFTDRKDVDKFAHVASMQEVIDNEYNLNIPRYVDTFEPEEEIDLNEVAGEIRKLQREIKEIDAQLKPFFEELGLDFPFDEEGK